MLSEWLLLGLGGLLTLGTAFFVAAEFAFVTLDRPTVQQAVAAGDTRAASVLPALATLSTQLSGAQVGITATTLLVGYLAEPSLSALLEPGLAALAPRVGLDAGVAGPVAVAVALVVATVFSMVVGELVPKNLALARPLPTARTVARAHRAFTVALGPLIRVLNGAANRVLGALGIQPREELSGSRTAEELAWLVRRSAEVGTLDEQTARLLTRSLGFTAHSAADVMTPRTRMQTLPRSASALDVVRLARSTGLSRFPVVGEDLDDVLGVVHLKSAVSVPRARRADVPVTALMSQPVRLPQTVRLVDLLRTLRAGGLQLAVVVDEYGGTAGVATLEDVVEEIVGEVVDEHDRVGQPLVRRRDGSWLVPGLRRPDEVKALTGVSLPEGRAYQTVGGLVMAGLGRVPRLGDELEVDGARLRVLRLDGRRVDQLVLLPAPPPGGGDHPPAGQPGPREPGGAR